MELSEQTDWAQVMRILVATGLNSGAAEYKNVGDIAMLQIAVKRLLSQWPNASIEVLTDSPADLSRHCPGTKAVSRAACLCLVGDHALLGRFNRLLPKPASAVATAVTRALASNWPSMLEWLVGLRLQLQGAGKRGDFRTFANSLRHAHLLVVCGSGGFADSCRVWNLSMLETIEAATRRSVPVAMFGQGMGPLSDKDVLSRARRIFPKLQMITLRGSEGGTQLLESLGVPPSKITTTGDEAIELAYSARRQEVGHAIGINLRVASYSEVKAESLQQIKQALQAAARRYQTALLPIPIALHEYANDAVTIRQLLSGFDDDSDGGASLTTPSQVIQQAARCRIVVTGAYHAAVFALAQGIPAICLAKSDYYLKKFEGLRRSFGPACEILNLSEPDFVDKLNLAIDETWASAVTVRDELLHAASQQIARSQRAYRFAKEIVESSSRKAYKDTLKLRLDTSTLDRVGSDVGANL
jgi:polysaccharide pyruvyl transferase WcaK-like protein